MRLKDVARVELGAQNYTFDSELNGNPVAGIAVQMTPGANALATAEGVNARMKELERSFPSDITWKIPYNTTPFITVSIEEVVKALGEAAIATARKIGVVEADMGDTACKIPDAESYILKARRGAPIAPKRKTVRC